MALFPIREAEGALFSHKGAREAPYLYMKREVFHLFKKKSKTAFLLRIFHPFYSHAKNHSRFKLDIFLGFLKKSVHETREVISCSTCPCQTDHNGENPKTWT